MKQKMIPTKGVIKPEPKREMPMVLSKKEYVNNGLFILQNDYYRKILFHDILWLEASGSYCYLNLKEDKRIIVVHPLAELEKTLPKDIFTRIHRSFMVNIFAVDAFIGNTLCIGKTRLYVSNSFRKSIFSHFHILGRKKD